MNRIFKTREFWLAIGIAVMIGAIATRAPSFAAPANLADIFNCVSYTFLILSNLPCSAIFCKSSTVPSNNAIPICACLSAPTSFVPSPAMSVKYPRDFSVVSISSFCEGETRA